MIGRNMALDGSLWTPVPAATQFVIGQTCGLDDVAVADPVRPTSVLDVILDVVVAGPAHPTGLSVMAIAPAYGGLDAMLDAVKIAAKIEELTKLVEVQQAAQIAAEVEVLTNLIEVQQAAQYVTWLQSHDRGVSVSTDEETETDVEEVSYPHRQEVSKKRAPPIYADTATFSGKYYSYNGVPFEIYMLPMNGVEHEIVVPNVTVYGQTEHCIDAMARKEACRIYPFRMLDAMKGLIPAVIAPVGVYIDFADPNRRNARFRACFLDQLKAVLENEGCAASTRWMCITRDVRNIPAGLKPPKTRKKKAANAIYAPPQAPDQLTANMAAQNAPAIPNHTLTSLITIPDHTPTDIPDHTPITIPTYRSNYIPYPTTKRLDNMYFQSFDTEDCLMNHPLEPCTMSVKCQKKRKYGQ
jgi:hypothetical protein